MKIKAFSLLAGAFACPTILFLSACSSSQSSSGPSDDGGASPDGSSPGDAGAPSDARAPDATGGADAAGAADASDASQGEGGSAPATFNVFDKVPQFGIYTSTNPNYTPPASIIMWKYGTEWVTKLSAEQKSSIGSDLAARITYLAQCDNYDRLGGIFFVVEPTGQTPQATDPRTELVRFITPFSDYTQGALATHVYPNADISTFAHVLADPTRDVWIGIEGGSNPYSGDPCTNLTGADAAAVDDFKAVGFSYSLDFVSTKPLASAGATTVVTAMYDTSETKTPISGTLTASTTPISGHVTVIVTSHGPGNDGDEYEYTRDALLLSGNEIGFFTTQIDCSSYAQFSPDGNPALFQENLTVNPRNWCPGALVPSHTFPATLTAASSTVELLLSPSAVPPGSYIPTSITFTSP